jgi:uncharacterized membrane protein
MNNTRFITIVVALTIFLGALIGWGIAATQWKKELIQVALDKGQNPMYIKCAMERDTSQECKTLITAIAIAKSDK